MPKQSTLDLIGNTPLVALPALSPPGGTIWAKAEFQNPGGSVKDRAALCIVDSARQSGKLRPGQTVVERTSGNMGAGLAVVCAVRGHPLVTVMSRGNSPERARMLAALGAEVVLVDQVDGQPGQVTGRDLDKVSEEAERITAQRDGFYADQFNNPHSVIAHETTTGPEILRELGASLTAFVSVVGSAGTFVGVSRFLKRQRPEIKCVAVEPLGAEVLAGHPVIKPKHILQGIGYGAVPPQWDPKLADLYTTVSDEEAAEFKRFLAHREGLHVGYTAAANVCAAAKLISSGAFGPKAHVATILCDTGLKYG